MATKLNWINIGNKADLPDSCEGDETLFFTEEGVHRSDGDGNPLIRLGDLVTTDTLPDDDDAINGKLYIIGTPPSVELWFRIQYSWLFFASTNSSTSTTIISEKTVSMESVTELSIEGSEFTNPQTSTPKLVEFIYNRELIGLEFELLDNGGVKIIDDQGLSGVTVRLTRDLTATGGGVKTVDVTPGEQCVVYPYQFSPAQSGSPTLVEFIYNAERISLEFSIDEETGAIIIDNSEEFKNLTVKRS